MPVTTAADPFIQYCVNDINEVPKSVNFCVEASY